MCHVTQIQRTFEKLVKAYYWEEVFESENLGREILLVIMEQLFMADGVLFKTGNEDVAIGTWYDEDIV